MIRFKNYTRVALSKQGYERSTDQWPLVVEPDPHVLLPVSLPSALGVTATAFTGWGHKLQVALSIMLVLISNGYTLSK